MPKAIRVSNTKTTAHASETKDDDKLPPLAQDKKRSDILDKSPNRRRACSPVSAPLTHNKPTPEDQSAPKTPEHVKIENDRLKKRRLEKQMWKAFHENPCDETRNELWVHYQSLVRYIAERTKARLPECIDVNDLVSSGNLGLQDAILKFDPSRGTRFETFCVPRIRGAMVDSIRAMDWVPRLIRNKSHQFDRLVREMTSQLGREPREEEIAERLQMNMKKLNKLRKEMDVKVQISLEGGNSDHADERDLMRLEMLEDRHEANPTRELQREEIRGIALRGLSRNERVVVEEYYFGNRSMKQIGDSLGLSESRICQIHAQVLEVLKKKFKAYRNSVYL